MVCPIEQGQCRIVIDELLQQDITLVFEDGLLYTEKLAEEICFFSKLFVLQEGTKTIFVMFGRRHNERQDRQRQARGLESRHFMLYCTFLLPRSIVATGVISNTDLQTKGLKR